MKALPKIYLPCTAASFGTGTFRSSTVSTTWHYATWYHSYRISFPQGTKDFLVIFRLYNGTNICVLINLFLKCILCGTRKYQLINFWILYLSTKSSEGMIIFCRYCYIFFYYWLLNFYFWKYNFVTAKFKCNLSEKLLVIKNSRIERTHV